MLVDDFDCNSCTFVEPVRCDLRADPSFLDYYRRRLYWEPRAFQDDFERAVHQALVAAKRIMSADEVFAAIGSTSRAPRVEILVERMRASPELFLNVGGDRFAAISHLTTFHTDTDNLWFRLPQFDSNTPERTRQMSRRVQLWSFVSVLPMAPTLLDGIRRLWGPDLASWPPTRDITQAKVTFAGQPDAYAGAGFLHQQWQRNPRPSVHEPFDLAAIRRDGELALHRIVEDNLRLIAGLAFGFAGRGVDFVDLCQESVLALVRATQKYDPDRGAFSTYATWWIRQMLWRTIQNDSRLIRVPVHVFEKTPWLQHERIPQRIPPDAPPSLRPMASLDQLAEDQMPLVDWQDRVESKVMIKAVRGALAGLTEREERVLEARYGLNDDVPRTLEDIGREFGLTRERIRQIQSKAVKRLKHPRRGLRRLLESASRGNTSALADFEPATRLPTTEKYLLAHRLGVAAPECASLTQLARATNSATGVVQELINRALSRFDSPAREQLSALAYELPPRGMQSLRVAGWLRNRLGVIPADAPDLAQARAGFEQRLCMRRSMRSSAQL